jgi:hypothetical protein
MLTWSSHLLYIITGIILLVSDVSFENVADFDGDFNNQQYPFFLLFAGYLKCHLC